MKIKYEPNKLQNRGNRGKEKEIINVLFIV